MKFVIISIKCILPEPPVVLTRNLEAGLSLKKAAREFRLDTMNTNENNVLPEIGSSFGNVIFIFDNEFQIDPRLEADTERGFFEFKEPEHTSVIDVTKTILGKEEVFSFYFDNIQTARRFIDKKIFGEFYLLKSTDDQIIFYPQLKEVYLFSPCLIEVGFVGFLDCKNILSAKSATITELAIEPTDKKVYKMGNIDANFELPVWQKYRLEFPPGSGIHVIRMVRGKGEVRGKGGTKYWSPKDEVLKIHVCEG